MKYTPISEWSEHERRIGPKGYWLIMVPKHPKSFSGGWYYCHRLVVEAEWGRILPSWATVHHINEDKTDNSLQNLFVCTRAEHDLAARTT